MRIVDNDKENSNLVRSIFSVQNKVKAVTNKNQLILNSVLMSINHE
jgi:hypothetical protein